jgi:hypothetical protein
MSRFAPHGLPMQDYGAFTGKVAQAELVASVALTCSTTAALTTSIALSASPSLTLISTAALTTVTQFAASLPLSLTASGRLFSLTGTALMPHGVPGQQYGAFNHVQQIFLDTSVPLTLTTSAALTTVISLAASQPLTLTASAGVESGGPWALLAVFLAFDSTPTSLLDGSATMGVTATGSLQTAIALSASAAMGLQSTAALTTSIRLATSIPLTLTATATSLTTAITAAGSALGSLTVTGTLSTAIALGGAASASLQVTGTLQTSIALAASRSMGLSSAAFLITLASEFQGGLVAGLLSTSGSLQTGASPFGSATSLTMTAAGSLSTVIALAGSASASMQASASTLTSAIMFAATAPLTLSVSGSLTTVVNLAASIPLTLTAAGDMRVPAQLAASLPLTMAMTGSMTTGLTLAADCPLTFVVTSAALTTAILMGGSALLQLIATAAPPELHLGDVTTFGVPPRIRIFPIGEFSPAGVVSKRPSESFVIGIDFAARLEDGETLTQATATAHDQQGTSSTSSILSGAASASAAGVVTVRCVGGTSGQRHTVELRGTSSLGNILEGEIVLCVEASAYRVGALTKQPHESEPVGIDFARWLDVGTDLVDTTPTKRVTAYNDATTLDSTSQVIGGSGTVESPRIAVRVIAGQTGQRHIVAYRVPTSAGDVLEAEVALSIEET